MPCRSRLSSINFHCDFDDRALAKHEIADRDVALDVKVDAVEPALAQAGEIERRLAQRLGWNRAGVDRRAARLRRALDDADALAEVRRLRGALFAGRAGADDDEIVMVHAMRDGRWAMWDLSRRESGDQARLRDT